MISPADRKLLSDAVAVCDENVHASPFDKGYATALRVVLIMLTTRSNAQGYNIGRDSLLAFKNRHAKVLRRRGM